MGNLTLKILLNSFNSIKFRVQNYYIFKDCYANWHWITLQCYYK